MRIAQLVEHWFPKPKVGGSSPFPYAKNLITPLRRTSMKSVTSWQERVIVERDELDEKITKLDSFLSKVPEKGVLNPDEISIDMRVKLRQQLLAMKLYLSILIERLRNFDK